MKKAELLAAVQQETKTLKNISHRSVKLATEEVMDALAIVLQRQLVAGEPLLIPGIGTFSVIQKAARLGRNPKTGDSVEIPAKKTVKFKATKTLADAVNE